MELQSNFFPIDFLSDKFYLRKFQYTDEKLTELRDKYNTNYSFFRVSDNIYCAKMTEEDSAIEDGIEVEFSLESLQKREIDLNADDVETVQVISSLIKHTFFRTFKDKFKDKIRKPSSFYPFELLSNNHKDDLLNDILPAELSNHLKFIKSIEIQLRKVKPHENTIFGFVVNYSYKWVFDRNCDELVNDNFDIIGLDVLILQEIMPDIILPDETLIGKISKVDKLNCTAVVETNLGEQIYPLKDLFLRKDKTNIGKYLSEKLGANNAEIIFNQCKEAEMATYSGDKIYSEIKKITQQLNKLVFKTQTGFEFKVNVLPIIPTKTFGKNIEAPTFIFDYGLNRIHKTADIGLNNFGPYDRNKFTPKNVNVLVICQKVNRGYISTFIEKLKNGINSTSLSSNYFKIGLQDKYKLTDVCFHIFEVDNYYDLSTYRRTISQAITYAHENDFAYNIALIETTENAKRIEASKSPYYHCKSALMAANIPTQFVLSSNIKKTDYELQSILNAMALQMYAKIGGTPWVIPSNKGVDREIIVGVGHSIMRSNWYSGNTQSRFVAISTFFAGDGTYLLGAKSQDVAYEDYFEELFNSLKNSINSLSEKFAWEKGETVRIVFHLFKQVKNIEIEVIDKLMSSYTDFKLSYAFVTISSYHPFYLFDISNNMGKVDRNGNKKGVFMPKRSTVQILDENSCLIQMKGSEELKTHKQRMTKPLLIRIHDKSTFKDLHFIVQQIYNFTYLSWKTFLPFEQPVSLYYSTLIANQLAKLRLIEKWNPDVINLNFKHKKWFL